MNGEEGEMGKKTPSRPKQSKTKPPKDLSAGPRATNIKAGVRLQGAFVKSWSTSGDAD
jgi:hypothetical protein